ncbi:MAG: leucine-rich repeat domain-containing protein, partial [Clostridia bacterium]|nr:leucine-rich repeat domain-containing protein [Clostridia bacterium]
FLEIHESDVTIRWYDPELGFGKIGKDNVYKINSTTFDVEVFAPKAQKGNLAIFQLPEFELKERIDFEKCAKENPNGVDTGLRGKDLVSPRLLERLKGDGFICKVTDEGKIHIVGFAPKTPTDTVDIPDYVHRIESGAFKNNSSIKNVYTKAKEIGADAFRDCKNIETLLLFDGIETLEPNIFESEKLTELEIPATVKLVRNYSFFHCKNLKKVRFSDKSKCDVEHMAFPIDCEIIDEAAPKAPEKKEEEHKERKSLLSMLLSPLSAMRSLLKSTSSITFIGAALMAVYVVLAMTGAIQYLSWESRPISPSDNIFFGYEWELGALGVMLFGKISGSGIWGVFIFIAALLVLLIGGLIDIILYVLMFLVLVALPMIVQVLLQLLLIFGFPAIIPIGAFVLIFTARRKLPPILTFLISTPCAVIYFMNLASYL